MQELKPFDRLDQDQQRCCIDISIGMAIIAARVPSFGAKIFKDICREWADSSGIDQNLCKYALNGVAAELYNSNWEFHVTKEGQSMVCQFISPKKSAGANGEHPIP